MSACNGLHKVSTDAAETQQHTCRTPSVQLAFARTTLLRTLIVTHRILTLCMIVTAADTEKYKPLPKLNQIYKLSDEIVNPYSFSLVINAEPCHPKEKLLIVVHSSPKVRVICYHKWAIFQCLCCVLSFVFFCKKSINRLQVALYSLINRHM